jgi:hypothetical protein
LVKFVMFVLGKSEPALKLSIQRPLEYTESFGGWAPGFGASDLQ